MANRDMDNDTGNALSITLKEVLSSWEEKYLQWRRFSRTRKAFLSGESLQAWSDDARTQNGFMNPWKFDLYESILATAPAILLTKVTDFLVPPPKLTIDPNAFSYGMWLVPEGLKTPVAKLVDPVQQTLTPFLLPLSLMILVVIIVRATLAKEERSIQKNKMIRDAYFYLDGAHGLLPQTLFNVALIFLIILGIRGIEAPLVTVVCVVMMVISFIHEWWMVYKRVPRFLFSVAGHADGKLRKWTLFRKKTAIEKRWKRYRRIIPLGGLLILFLNFFVLQVCIWIIAVALASIQQLV